MVALIQAKHQWQAAYGVHLCSSKNVQYLLILAMEYSKRTHDSAETSNPGYIYQRKTRLEKENKLTARKYR